jgi:hypothetical protein
MRPVVNACLSVNYRSYSLFCALCFAYNCTRRIMLPNVLNSRLLSRLLYAAYWPVILPIYEGYWNTECSINTSIKINQVGWGLEILVVKSAADKSNPTEREAMGDDSICIPHVLCLFFERSVMLKMHFMWHPKHVISVDFTCWYYVHICNSVCHVVKCL